MKYLKFSILAFAIVFATACKDNKKETEKVEDTTEKTSSESEQKTAKISRKVTLAD